MTELHHTVISKWWSPAPNRYGSRGTVTSKTLRLKNWGRRCAMSNDPISTTLPPDPPAQGRRNPGARNVFTEVRVFHSTLTRPRTLSTNRVPFLSFHMRNNNNNMTLTCTLWIIMITRVTCARARKFSTRHDRLFLHDAHCTPHAWSWLW